MIDSEAKFLWAQGKTARSLSPLRSFSQQHAQSNDIDHCATSKEINQGEKPHTHAYTDTMRFPLFIIYAVVLLAVSAHGGDPTSDFFSNPELVEQFKTPKKYMKYLKNLQKKDKIKHLREEKRKARLAKAIARKEMQKQETAEFFNLWIEESAKVLKSNKNAHIIFHEDLNPKIQVSNNDAPPDACTVEEDTAAMDRLVYLFQGILQSRGFKKLQDMKYLLSSEASPDRRHLRGDSNEDNEDDRELQVDPCWDNCDSWYCMTMCPNGRRLEVSDYPEDERKLKKTDSSNNRVMKNDAHLELKEMTPEDVIAITTDVQEALVEQCQKVMGLVAIISKSKPGCKAAMKMAVCEVQIDLLDLAELKLKKK